MSASISYGHARASVEDRGVPIAAVRRCSNIRAEDFAVGTRVTSRPRTEPYGRLSRIRLPPRMFDGWPRPSVRAPAPCDTLSRLGVRHVRLVRVLLGLRPSLHRLRCQSPGLVRRLRCYYGGVDFSCPCIIGFGSSPSRCGPSLCSLSVGHETLPGSDAFPSDVMWPSTPAERQHLA